MSSEDLIALEAKATIAHNDVERAQNDALDHALKAGAILLEIVNRGLVKRGQREALYARTCNTTRTGQTYVRLAEHRDLLEQTRRGSAPLSINTALRLISKSEAETKPKPERTRTSPKAATTVKTEKPEAPLPDFSAMSNADWTRALDEALGIDRFYEVVPKHWLPALGKRMLALEKSKSDEAARDKRLRKRLAQRNNKADQYPRSALVH